MKNVCCYFVLVGYHMHSNEPALVHIRMSLLESDANRLWDAQKEGDLFKYMNSIMKSYIENGALLQYYRPMLETVELADILED